jgi:hypothetical protein
MLEQPDELFLFSPETLLRQIELTPLRLGYHEVRFYVTDDGLLSKTPTETIGKFYLSPSGGTLRDENMNIVLYSAKYDKFKGLGRL